MLKYFSYSINVRFYSIKHATKYPTKYTETINLPKTKFPNRLTTKKREEIERQLLLNRFANSYSYQEVHNKEPTFILHDGPPYANGDLHMGHAVNKILKDICLRQHVAKGEKVHYIPGWDCHGLPIELKATNECNKEEPLTIRRKSRQFALNAVERQKEEFQSWGVLADWSNKNKCYLTIKPEFIKRQIELFYKFYENGLVYRDVKPVYWSPSSRTALAEAELEYDPNFESLSVYLRFALTNLPVSISNPTVPIYALIWTTTPWTLPSNQAVCYNENLEYAVVKLSRQFCNDGLYLLASNLINDFESITKLQCQVVYKIKGVELDCCSYQHPINKEKKFLKFFKASHVQDTKGTGLVHTAPAHGPDDFLVSLEQNLKVLSYVDEQGTYNSDAPKFLRGQSVLECGDKLVLENITNDIVFSGKLIHSYPIDWRTKKPVIIRASEQWFMNTDSLKKRALEELANIEIYPRINAEANKKSLETQVRKRPYWCISRQRVWGVPIPVFYRKENGKAIVDKQIITHICDLVQKHGNIDFWWSQSIEELLPQQLLYKLNLNASSIVRGTDIFDIWFDSGSTWASVLSDYKNADLYLEGYDQFTGWFQSSLLTSIAARNCTPYKSLFVHGFTVDEKGHKMSKSLGNVISPKDIIKNHGTDVLRWWVASHATQHVSIIVSDNLLKQSAEILSKVRATLRYLNGVVGEINTMDVREHEFSGESLYINKFLLSKLVDFDKDIQRAYDAYEYNRVVTLLQNFISNQISAIYIHTIKDRLYCGNESDLANIRFTLKNCYELLCKALWPLTPFLVEESWSYYAKNSAFYERTVKAEEIWKNTDAEHVIESALNVKRIINQSAGEVNTWMLSVELKCNKNSLILKKLNQLHPNLGKYCTDTELCEILQLNQVKLTVSNTDISEVAVKIEPLKDLLFCPRCRRFNLDNIDLTLCARCSEVLKMKK